MARRSEQLELPFPSPPSRPPKYAIRFLKSGRLIAIETFSAAYSAKKYIDIVVGEYKTKWMSSKELEVENGVRIVDDDLEEVMEHEYTDLEDAWVLPEPMRSQAEYLHTGVRQRIAPPPAREELEEGDKRRRAKERRSAAPGEPAAPQRNAKKPPSDGITLADICKRLKIEPREARSILRKQTIDKPYVWDKENAAKVELLLKERRK